MSAPKRIQLRRTKGWRKPEGAIVVSRPSKWGNPAHWEARPTFDPVTGVTTPADPAEARRISADWYDAWLTEPNRCEVTDVHDERRSWILEHVHELAGRDLACWCPLDQPCHADVLLELANAPARPMGAEQ